MYVGCLRSSGDCKRRVHVSKPDTRTMGHTGLVKASRSNDMCRVMDKDTNMIMSNVEAEIISSKTLCII